MKIDTQNKLQKVLLKTVDTNRNHYLMNDDNEIKYEIIQIIVFCLGWWHSYNGVTNVDRMIETLKKINKDMLTKNKEIALKDFKELEEKLNELED